MTIVSLRQGNKRVIFCLLIVYVQWTGFAQSPIVQRSQAKAQILPSSSLLFRLRFIFQTKWLHFIGKANLSSHIMLDQSQSTTQDPSFLSIRKYPSHSQH
ncbi:hypothetical protein BDV29DRAFT_167823 [Aspergillus leporis]|uniref:Uncharacterized protein n=1 Tax=Aspergillus leporis TaxID=41062 RepID=A0A5N5XAV4_9EURO|nr:hypothetical protein BDV29DRAFT_167823 [Aspergillus leporis]